MNKTFYALVLLLSLVLTGCVRIPADTPTLDAAPPQTAATDPRPTQVTGEHLLQPTHPKPLGDSLTLGQTGAARVSTSVIISSVRYITSADQLPDNEALAQYDAAYFETGALVLIMETVNSGSVRVDIDTVTVADGIASVQLLHAPQGDLGVPAMTTWMLWAEVPPELDLKWVVENPAMDSDVSKE